MWSNPINIVQVHKGPSIYDAHIHMEGQAQVDTCGWGDESAPCGCPHKEFEPTLTQRSSFLELEFLLWME